MNTYTLILLLLPGLLQAQTWSFRQYTAEQGLPSTEVYDILQDRKGYIWVATDRGVARFDGYSFESFTTAEGLSNNVVFRICEGPDGKIWFGEMPGTLSYFENGKIYQAPENKAILKHIRHASFPLSISAGKDYVDVGYTGSSVLRLQQGKIRELYPGDSLQDVVAVKDNIVCFGTKKTSGLTLVDYNRRYVFYQKGWSHGAYRIDALKRRNGDLIVTLSGVVRIFNKKGLIQQYVTNDIVSFSETADSSLYAISLKGFYRYAPNEPFRPDNRYCHLRGYRVNKVIRDREGGIWVSTLDKGVLYCANPDFSVYDLRDDPPGESTLVYALCGDYRGKVFAGLENGSIYCITGGKQPVRIFSPARSSIYGHLYYDTVHRYLLTGRTDLIDPAYRREVRYLPVATGNGVVAYRKGYLCGYYGALSYCYPEGGQGKWHDTKLSQKEPQIQCMLRLTGDSIFIGTLKGLCYYSQGVLKPALNGTTYATERINDIECTGGRTLILSTIGKGLLLYDLISGRLERIGKSRGLPSDVINDAALAPDGAIWLAGNKGLSRLKRNAAGKYDILNYTTDDGIPAADIKQVHVDGNTVYMTSHLGLTRLDRRSTVIGHDAEMLLRAVYINDRAVPPQALTRLGARDNNLRISYLSIIPKMQGKVLYRYRLKNTDGSGNWVYVREPQLSLSSLKPGNYQLIIQACNSSGQWSKTPLLLPVRIAAPFWKTGWFIAGCVAVVALAIILLQQARMKGLRRRTANEKLMLDYQQKALMNQINPHFLFNSMNSIQKYILREDKERAVSFVSKFAKLMRLGLEYSRETFISLHQEIELLHIYMLLEQERFGKKVQYTTIIQPGLETRHMLVPPLLIQPFLENAIRHGILHKEGGGTITLRLYRKEQLLFCEVEDDGIGRQRAATLSREPAHRSLATNINTTRLQLLARSLGSPYYFEIMDKSDEQGNAAGTLVRLIIPFKNDD